MAIERSESQQTTCNATALIDGERRQAAAATCTIRPGRGMIFSIDVPPSDMKLEPDDLDGIANMFKEYLEDELKKARTLGIPI